jgi:hypothetical protein
MIMECFHDRNFRKYQLSPDVVLSVPNNSGVVLIVPNEPGVILTVPSDPDSVLDLVLGIRDELLVFMVPLKPVWISSPQPTTLLSIPVGVVHLVHGVSSSINKYKVCVLYFFDSQG